MKATRLALPLLLVSFLFSCNQPANTDKGSDSETDTSASAEVIDDMPSKGPCDSPKTVQELLDCAGKYGNIDSSKVINGLIANNGNCLKSWIDTDTVLLLWYSDSVTLYRVQPSANTSTDVYGSWFTNVNALNHGLTKEETLDKYALNNCSDFSYDTCVCNGHILPPDSLIQYEVTARIAPHREMQFGIVSPNRFGKGGNLQWHLTKKVNPPYTVVKQTHWQ